MTLYLFGTNHLGAELYHPHSFPPFFSNLNRFYLIFQSLYVYSLGYGTLVTPATIAFVTPRAAAIASSFVQRRRPHIHTFLLKFVVPSIPDKTNRIQ
jgi:hypothetical protein